MRSIKLVEKLAGKAIGVHFVTTLPRAGEFLIGPDSKVWSVLAVGHYSHLTEETADGPVAEVEVTLLA